MRLATNALLLAAAILAARAAAAESPEDGKAVLEVSSGKYAFAAYQPITKL
jgi:hypothetical protein